MLSVVKNLKIYNSISGKKEIFSSVIDNHVGMYVCGPTVYSNVHLGNLRTFTSFDIIYRYLTHLGYKVSFVVNIQDVVILVNIVLETIDANECQLEFGDLNGDSISNILDVIIMVNIILESL